MQKIINFIKYHNAVPIILGVVLLGTAGAFASEDVRNAVIGERVETAEGIDNRQILAVDLDNFDLNLQIANITEDEENYYTNYAYQTLAIKDNIWQLISKGAELTVSKEELAGKDLGLYIQEEIGEVADYELKYLKEVQALAREGGRTELIISVDYTGLIGLVLDIKNKTFPEYQPVVSQPEPERVITYYVTSTDLTPGVDEETQTLGVDEETPSVNAAVCQNGANRDCGSGVGTCQIGVEICQGGQWSGTCLGSLGPMEEILDKVDNNCDGQTDEGLTAAP